MNAFYEHHHNNIRFGYRCFDRILLNGLIQPFQQPERVVGFFSTYRDQYPVSRDVLREIADGAVDNAVNLARWKSSCRQLPVVGRRAYPMRAKATTHVLLGRKRLSCPAGKPAAVGAIREASQLGGLNITK